MRKDTILFVMMAVLFSSCGTEKNTPLSRSFHKTKVKYNIYYNGHTSYEEGMEATARACQDDYTDIIYLYPVSDHTAAEAAKSQMERTIEKCRKCIKLHSIKKKPKPDPKKRTDPVYRAWLEQEEFNPAMPEAWMLLAKAEFHKGDFLGSIGTLRYIEKHFAYDKDIVAQCQLWQARAYAEIDWIYEAQQLVDNVRQDDLSRKHASLYSSTMAVVRIKSGMYREAIPHLRIALQDEKRKGNRPRAYYVLGQLYEKQGQKSAAIDSYQQVLKLNPTDIKLDFNAELRLAELQATPAAAKRLTKMAKRPKYKDYLDQLYGTLGNIYLHQGDTTQALTYYHQAAEESTANGIDKAVIMVRAADLYYGMPDYPHAGECYTEAAGILTAEHPDYKRVVKRSEVLQGLITDVNMVTLQDSLQYLSTLSEEKQMAVVQQIIADLEAAEAAAAEAEAQAERAAKNGDTELQGVNTSKMVGGAGATGEWYFYNANLIRQGKQDFAKKWGTRQLEDNWRRSVKAASSMPTETTDADDDMDEQLADSIGAGAADSLAAQAAVKAPISTDPHDPQYYLQQIPKTAADFHASDSLIALSLADMVGIYENELEDHAAAERTVSALRTRFPDFNGLLGIYYDQYLSALRRKDTLAQRTYREAIVMSYPQSEEARIVTNSEYFERLSRMAAEQDSVYEATYTAYRAGEWATVKRNKQYAAGAYPMSPLMPKFAFLSAIATAKTDGQAAFVEALQELVEAYPESELGTMSKDMLAMMNEGLESRKGGKVDQLSEARSEQIAAEEEETAAEAEEDRYDRIYVLVEGDEKALGNMLYEVALFNFSQFLIKDFDLRAEQHYRGGQMAVEISGFESADEREWYIGLLQQAMPEARIER